MAVGHKIIEGVVAEVGERVETRGKVHALRLCVKTKQRSARFTLFWTIASGREGPIK